MIEKCSECNVQNRIYSELDTDGVLAVSGKLNNIFSFYEIAMVPADEQYFNGNTYVYFAKDLTVFLMHQLFGILISKLHREPCKDSVLSILSTEAQQEVSSVFDKVMQTQHTRYTVGFYLQVAVVLRNAYESGELQVAFSEFIEKYKLYEGTSTTVSSVDELSREELFVVEQVTANYPKDSELPGITYVSDPLFLFFTDTAIFKYNAHTAVYNKDALHEIQESLESFIKSNVFSDGMELQNRVRIYANEQCSVTDFYVNWTLFKIIEKVLSKKTKRYDYFTNYVKAALENRKGEEAVCQI